MKLINYIGAEGPCVVLEQPTDVYPFLDVLHSMIMVKAEEHGENSINRQKWMNSADHVAKLMEQTEEAGFGSMEDVEKIKH